MVAVIVVIEYPSNSSPLDFFYWSNVIIMVGIPHRTSIFKWWSDKARVGFGLCFLETIAEIKFNVLVALDVTLLTCGIKDIIWSNTTPRYGCCLTLCSFWLSMK